MAEGAQCGVCFAGALALQAGMLVCDACGNVSQASERSALGGGGGGLARRLGPASRPRVRAKQN
jgi:hypothetical protein